MNPRIANPLQSKIDMARKAGYNDDEIMNFLGTSAPIQAPGSTNAGGLVMPGAPAQSKTSGRGGFLTSLISELGGAGGAAGGAAIGTALLPGIGTILGAGLGGFLGGTGGRVAENKVRDDRIGLGDALKEGAISGAFSGLGSGFQAIKGAKAAKNALGGVDDVSRIAKLGNKTKSMGIGGIDLKKGIGAFDDEATRLATAKKFNIPSGLKGLRKSEELVGGLEKKITPLLKNTQIPVKNVLDSIDNAALTTLSPVAESPQLLQNIRTLIQRQADGDFISADAVRNIRSGLGQVFKKNSVAPIAGLQKDFYRSLGDTIGEFAPKAKSLISQQGELFDIADGLAKRGAGARLPIPGGFFGKSTALGQARDAVTDRAAGALSGVGNVTGSAIGREAFRQQVPQLAGDLAGAFQTPEPTLEDALMQYQDGSDTGFVEEEVQTGPTQADLQNAIIADIQETGGKNIDKITTVFELFSQQNAAPKMNATQQQRALTSASGLRSLDTLEDVLSRDPGAFARQALPNPLGITARLTGTTDVRAATDNIVDVIARLRSGAAITDDEAKRFARLLPQAGDSPESARRKIQNVRLELESFVNPDATTTLEDALLQSQGGY